MKNGFNLINLMCLSLAVFSITACSEQLSTDDNRLSSSGSQITARDSKDDDRDNNDDDNVSNLIRTQLVVDCPVGLVSGLPLDEEFGSGSAELTRCLENHSEIKVVYALNKTCRNPSCDRAYGLGNINNAIKDYEITHGLSKHENYHIVAVLYSAGARLALDNNAEEPFPEINPFQEAVQDLIEKGVHVYLCQNTARRAGIVTSNLIPGVKYVTSGVTAIADFQLSEYAVVNP